MPIDLLDLEGSLAKSGIVTDYSPKFFDDKLTGRGGGTPGFLSNRNNPPAIDVNLATQPNDSRCIRKTFRSNQTVVTHIPLNTLTVNAWSEMKTIDVPAMSDLVEIGSHPKLKAKLYMTMDIHAIDIEETTTYDIMSGKTQTKRDVRTNYQIKFFILTDNPPAIASKLTHTLAYASASSLRIAKSDALYWVEYSSNPMQELQFDIGDKLRKAGWSLRVDLILDYMNNYEIYDTVARRSQEWQTTIHKDVEKFVMNLSKTAGGHITSSQMDVVYEEVRYLMSYNIPLELYKHIYAALKANFPAADLRKICKQNLNLLLSDTLNNLDANKALIPPLTPANTTLPLPASIQRLSKEQTKAVMSNSPLVLVQAGAGTGKSTLILGRIDYLVHSGVKPEDITVLSFTNAAADNISEKNPNVHSMTIARMIHEIYTANFANHELSTLDTIINSLDIYYPNVPGVNRGIVPDFQRRLTAMIKGDANNFTDMNNFIEEHYDAVIDMLDTIGQTSLELEIIICYQRIDSLVEPPTIASKYLIIDEVQDNSVFEFVYTLKYVDKHKESLFIVGDCSQTLYEFRASNPRALNILEGSGTFQTYQLTVNYRSNQEILDFANIALQNIEANQYANIQLRAHSLMPVTEQSFIDRVHFNYHMLAKLTELHNELPGIFSSEIRPYIEACLARGEKVAVLAYTRRDIAVIKQILEDQYPGKSCISLVPEKMYNMTVMTTFIKKFWHGTQFIPYTNIVNIIRRQIMANLKYIVFDDQKAAPRVQQMLDEWANEEGPTIMSWVNQVSKGQMKEADMLHNVKNNMIQYEIRKNAIKQALLSAQNQMIKKSGVVTSANFILSTIHSAKGLEFDNVIVLYRNDNQLSEEDKRMYYVALTRAMKSEYILAYDRTVSPQIQADYVTVLQGLHAVAPAANSPIDRLQNQTRRKQRIKI